MTFSGVQRKSLAELYDTRKTQKDSADFADAIKRRAIGESWGKKENLFRKLYKKSSSHLGSAKLG